MGQEKSQSYREMFCLPFSKGALWASPASISSLGNPCRDDELSLPCHQAQWQRGPQPNHLLIGTCEPRWKGKGEAATLPLVGGGQWGWQCTATSDQGVSPYLLTTLPPPTPLQDSTGMLGPTHVPGTWGLGIAGPQVPGILLESLMRKLPP